jgi:uncharacterized protein with NRDE domain
MCLLVIAFGVHADYPLIVAGNRDEFHERPTQEAQWWPDKADVLGGRDLEAGGTWLALHRRGRFATVTNYRGAKAEDGDKESRGHLVTGYLESELGALDYLRAIEGQRYAGFNLLVSDGDELAYTSNRGATAALLEPGIYGLSNAALDTPWSKVERSKASLRLAMEQGSLDEPTLFDILGDRRKGPAAEAEIDRLPFASAHALTAPFVMLPGYGTRSSSVVIRDADANWKFVERRFWPDGRVAGETRQSFQAQE